jgi:hypothetical protein
MAYDRSVPPDQWSALEERDVTRITDDLYVGWDPDFAHPTVWHWCTAPNLPRPRWVPSGTDHHQLVSRDPLHLEPSLYWPGCCGPHGFLRNGQWTSV